MSAAAVKYTDSSCDYKNYINSKTVQRALLVTSVVFGVLSIIPPLRFAGSMGLRAVAFLSSGNICSNGWKEGTKMDRAFMVGKIALVALGIAGAVLLSPAIIVASIAADTALHIKGLISDLMNEKYAEAFIRLAMIIINVLAIAAIVAGSWQLIVAACAISVAVMFAMAIKVGVAVFTGKEKDPNAWMDAFAYVALAGIGIGGCVTMAQIVHRIPEKATFDLTNNTEYTRYIYDKNGVIATLAPGESLHLELPYNELISLQTGVGGSTVGVIRIEAPDAPWYVPTQMKQPSSIDYIDSIKPPIAPSEIPYTQLPYSDIDIGPKLSKSGGSRRRPDSIG